MHTPYTPIQRLKRMRRHAKNSIEAEELLSCLIIFNDPFGRSAIVGIAPENMPEHIRIAAFATLRSWRIVEEVSRHRFTIDESIKALYPLTDDLRTRQLAFFARCRSVYDSVWLSYQMSDLKAARDWGLEHMPVFGRHLDNKMTATRQAPEELHQAIEDMNEAAQHINIRAMRAYILSLWGREAREANDWTRADEVYQKAITLYEEIDHQTDLFKMCMMRGNSASQLNHLSEARATYEQALALAERHRWYGREADVLWKLQDIVLQQGDLVTARSYFQRLLILEHRTGTVIWGRTLYSLGNVAAQLGEIAQARDFYARAATSRFDEGRSLWSWGQMEYRLGDKKAGCALCQIALLLAEEASETTTLEAVVQEFNLWKLKYAGMDCEDA